MSNCFFKQLQIIFEVVRGNCTGKIIFNEFGDYFNPELIEYKIEKGKLSIWFVTTEGSEQIEQICAEVQQSLEESLDARLVYKILSIDL